MKYLLDRIPKLEPNKSPGCIYPVNVSREVHEWIKEKADERNMPKGRFLNTLLNLVIENEFEGSSPKCEDSKE